MRLGCRGSSSSIVRSIVVLGEEIMVGAVLRGMWPRNGTALLQIALTEVCLLRQAEAFIFFNFQADLLAAVHETRQMYSDDSITSGIAQHCHPASLILS